MKFTNVKLKKRFYKIIIFFLAFLPLCVCVRDIVYAGVGIANVAQAKKEHGGWAPNTYYGDGSIYTNPGYEFEETAKAWGDKISDEDYLKDTFIETGTDIDNYVFNALTCVIGTICYSVGKALQSCGMGLCNIIYGRVLGFGTVDISGVLTGQLADVNLENTTFFQFELVQGNIYGYIGAILYAGIRVLAIVGIISIVLARLGASMVRQTGAAREELKSSLTNGFVMIALLFLMPFFLDLAIYIRNVLLYAIGRFCFDTFGTYNILDAFLYAYGDTAQLNVWVLDLGLLGVLIITIYFAFQYVSNAMGTMLMFVIFPFQCMLSSYDKNAIGNWVREMLGYLLVPVIDAFLLVVPIIMGCVAEQQVLLQVIAIGMIIPARQAVRGMLGMSSSSGIDRVGAFGAMAAISAVKTVASTVAKVVSTVYGGGAANLAGKVSGAMSGAKGETLATAEDQMKGVNGFGGSMVTRLPMDMDAEQRNRTQPFLDQYNALMSTGNADDRKKAQMLRADKLAEVESFLAPKSSKEDREKDRQEGAAKVDALTGSDNLGIGKNNEKIRELEDANKLLGASNSSLRLDNAKINASIESGMMDRDEGRGQIANNNVKIAENDKQIRANNENIKAYQEQNKLYEESVRGYKNLYGRDGIAEDKKNEVEMRFANAMNFDSGAFKSLTDAQKSAFYEQKSMYEHQRALGLGIGGAAGAALGFGGAMFMDPSTKLGAVTIGSSLGSELGGMLAKMPKEAPVPVASYSGASSFSMNTQNSFTGGSTSVNMPITGGMGASGTALGFPNFNNVRMQNGLPMDSATASAISQALVSQLNLKGLKPAELSDGQIDGLLSDIAHITRNSVSEVKPVVHYYINDEFFREQF